MNQIALNNQLSLSQIVYGVWRWDEKTQSEKEIQHIIETCLELGIDTFDHADIYNDYSNEAFFGKLFQSGQTTLSRPTTTGLTTSLRTQIKIITKCGIQLLSQKKPNTYVKHYDYSSAHIQYSVENSLKNLHTDYLDVLLLHRPSPLLNIHEVASTLEKLVQAGKVKHVGVSNFTPSQFSLLQSALKIPLITNQIELNLLHHNPLTDGTIDFLYERNIKPMIWSPLAGGKLFNNENTVLQNTLHQLNKKYNATTDALALAWLLKHPAALIPVIGTNKTDRIQVAAAATQIDLSLQDWFLLYEAALEKPVP